MGLEELQAHILEIPGAIQTVDLLRHSQQSRSPLKLALDGECCLDRLYGGYYPDWVSGGQWNKMETYLFNLITATRNSNVELVIFFNGCFESDRIGEITEKMLEECNFVVDINKHVNLKKKPPPKLWWIAPPYLKSEIRIILRNSNVKIVSTTDNHRKEIARYIKKYNYHGLLADDPEYFCYSQSIRKFYSAHKLKLTFKGTLETIIYNPDKIFDALGITQEQFPAYLTAIGNHIVPKNELKEFHSSLGDGPLFLDICQWMQSIKSLEASKLAEAMTSNEDLREKIIISLKYFSSANPLKKPVANKKSENKTNSQNLVQNQSEPEVAGALSTPTAATLNEESLVVGSVVLNDPVHTASTSKKNNSSTSVPKPQYGISQKIESVAITRHKGGLMSQFIMQILKHRTVLLPLIIEDAKSDHRLVDIYRPIRQRVYALLFNLHHLRFVSKENSVPCPKIEVSELYMDFKTKQMKADLVTAIEIGWPVPTIEKLWLGDGPEAKAKRLRAFFSIMKSDKTIFIEYGLVPQQFVVIGVVTRYLACQKLLRSIDIDAIIAQVLLLEIITDPELAQDIEVPMLSMKNIHLSQMLMEGVEMCLLANDACGSPIPFTLFNSSLFFNGKIFNKVLGELSIGKKVVEILNFRMELFLTFERIKSAITEGIESSIQQQSLPLALLPQNPMARPLLAPGSFGRIPLPPSQRVGMAQFGAVGGMACPMHRHSVMPMNYLDLARNPPQQSHVFQYDPRFNPRNQRGQLQVAGTVTGTWGPDSRVRRVSLNDSSRRTNAQPGRAGGNKIGNKTQNKSKTKGKKPGPTGENATPTESTSNNQTHSDSVPSSSTNAL